MNKEGAQVKDVVNASVVGSRRVGDDVTFKGRFEVTCVGRDGKEKWRDTIDNVVAIVGRNIMLDAALAGNPYTVVGPYMGLISSTSWSAVSENDTMSSHAGWLEAGGANAPTYSGTRKTCAWSSASAGSKALSSALSFSITGTGTVKGAFIVYGTNAVNTIGDTNGTLYSAGVFTGGDKVVGDGDTLNVSYTTSTTSS